METIVLLKLEVDLEKLKSKDHTDDHILTKIRDYIADHVDYLVRDQDCVSLVSSSLGVIQKDKTIQISSDPVVIKTHDQN